MDLRTARPIIKRFLKAGRNFGLVGQPGVGKTDTIREICASLTAADVFAHLAKPGDENRPVKFISIATTTKEAVDVSGLPCEKDGRTEWAPPSWLPTGDDVAVVFLDEFPQAEIPTQLGFQKAIDNDLDGVNLSERVVWIVAGNRVEDNAAAGDIPQHIRNRFSWLNIECDVDAWKEWAAKNHLLPSVIGFIGFRNEQLNTFSPNSEEYAYATPRSVAETARIAAMAPEEEWHAIASATCGAQWAAEWNQYREFEGRCPDIKDALKNPDGFEFPTEFGVTFAFTNLIAHGVDKSDSEDSRKARLRLIERLFDETDHKELASKTYRSLCAGDSTFLTMDCPEIDRLYDKLDSFLAA